jgi:hypothetical protein
MCELKYYLHAVRTLSYRPYEIQEEGLRHSL